MSGYKAAGKKYTFINGDENCYHTAQKTDPKSPKDSKSPPSSELADKHPKSVEANDRVSKAVPMDHKTMNSEAFVAQLQHSPVLVLAVGLAALSWWYIYNK